MNALLRRVIAVAGMAGYLAACALAPQVDPLARGRWRLNRDEAIARCRAATQRLGFDVDGWSESIVVRFNEKRNYWLRQRMPGRGSPLFSPLEAEATFVRPENGERISVRIAGAGRITGFTHRLAGAHGDGPRGIRFRVGAPPPRREEPHADDTREKPGDATIAEAKAREMFQLFVGDMASHFEMVTTGARNGNRIRYAWTIRNPATPEMRWTVRVDIERGQVVDAAGEDAYSDAFNRQYRTYSLFFGPSGLLFGVLAIVTVILAGMFFLLSAMRRTVNWRLALTVFAAVLILKIISFAGSPSVEAALAEVEGTPGPLSFAIGWVVAALFAGCLVAAGDAGARRGESSRWMTFRMLLAGRLGVTSVGSDVSLGIVGGGILACVTLLSGRYFSGLAPLPGVLPTTLVTPYPALSFLDRVPEWQALALFAGALPWLGGSLAASGLKRVLIVVAGLAAMLTLTPYGGPLAAIILCAVALLAVALLMYESSGVLTVLTAFTAASLFRHAIVLVNVRDATLVMAGWVDWGILLFAFLVALAVRSSGRVPTPAEVRVFSATVAGETYLTPREQMKVEIAQARKAQERMLPRETPRIPGMGISAICLPAKDLGGDLYDFLRLPNGRIAMCVADVSGKGVPAALYMTLTKGLLTASGEDCTQATEITRRLNTSLYEVARHKVFVTAAVGVLHPEKRTFELVRAGHNPAIWYSAASGETKFLTPKGLGLGFVHGAMFDRVTETETIELGPGDALLLYSDGLTEAMNSRQEQFGEERVVKALRASAKGDAERIRERILVEMSSFRGDAPAHDDVTLVILKVEDRIHPS